MIARAVLVLLTLSAGVAAGEPPPPYSLPWQLRPVAAGNVVRSDTSTAFYGTAGARGTTVSSMLLASWKLTPELAPLVRLAAVANDAPAVDGGPPGGAALVNPLLGLTWARASGRLRWAPFAAVTLPLGQGGGDSPDPGAAEAAARGIPARSAMDNAMFATNYLAGIGGVGAALVDRGFTAQAEVTVLQLVRVRGPEEQDARRTNLTAGLHLGWFAAPWLSVGGELRYQRWLTDAAPARANPDARDTVTVAAGPRLHLKLAGGRWLRPGLSYTRAIDAPLSTARYQMLQIDLPFAF